MIKWIQLCSNGLAICLAELECSRARCCKTHTHTHLCQRDSIENHLLVLSPIVVTIIPHWTACNCAIKQQQSTMAPLCKAKSTSASLEPAALL